MAIWASEVVWGVDVLATLYGRTADEARDAAVAWELAHCDENVPPADVQTAVPVAVAPCEECGDKFTATWLTIVAEGGHGQGEDGEPMMLMCVPCHMRQHENKHGFCMAGMVDNMCDRCFPETTERILYRRKQAKLAASRAVLSDATLEKIHSDIFSGSN